MREVRLQVRSDPTTTLGTYAMGLAFCVGWIACVGQCWSRSS